MSESSFLDCRPRSVRGTAPDAAIAAQQSAIQELHGCEAAAIRRRREIAGVGDPAPVPGHDESSAQPPDDLVGLALSGGGVRSAAFNLGFLQSLSRMGFMRYVDYLCSVSGGGYIAGHYTALASLPSGEDVAPCFHDRRSRHENGSSVALLGLADGQRLEPGAYRFRHMGEYLTDYVGFVWRYVVFTPLLLFWAACLLGILATIAALFWRLFDRPDVREYFDLVGLGELGTALHVGNETPHAFLPSVLCFLVLIALVLCRRIGAKNTALKTAVHCATIGWLISLGISIAVFLGNGETSLGASAELKKIQTHVTWPLMLLTGAAFLPLLAGRRLMQSGREHAPAWKKMVFHGVVGGATISAAFLMVHLMARENISGFATHRDSLLLPDDVKDWNAFLALVRADGPLPLLPEHVPGDDGDSTSPGDPVGGTTFALAQQREQIVGRTTWEQWNSLPLGHLVEGTRRLWKVHFRPGQNAWTYLDQWHKLRIQQQALLDTYINPWLDGHAGNGRTAAERANLTNRLLELAVVRADDATDDAADKAVSKPGSLLTRAAAERQGIADPFQIDERRNLEKFIDKRAKEMLEGPALAHLAHRYLLHMTQAGSDVGAPLQTFKFTPQQRAQFNRLLLECLFPEIIRERTMISTTIVPRPDQQYRRYWLAFWTAGFFLVGLVNINRLSPVYAYYRRRLEEYFIQSAPQAAAAASATSAPPTPDDWDALQNLRPWEQGAPYPLMLGSAFFLSKVGIVPPPDCGGAAGDAFKHHSFLFSPLYCGTAATGYQRTDKYCGGDLRLSEAMAMSGAALTPFMIDNVYFAGLMTAFNIRIGQWLPRPAACGEATGRRCLARPLSLLWELWQSLNTPKYSDSWQMTLVADGGFHDFFGLEELLLRRCKLIVVSDAGCNNDQYEFGALADVIRLARERHGIEIIDLDDDQAADLCGLRRIPGENRQQLYHTCLRVLYPLQPGETVRRVGLLIYAQMSLTGREQIDLQQFRKTHPNFPDEPITNQFFSHGQIESYRQLGFHIGAAVCREVQAQPVHLDDAADPQKVAYPSRQQIADELVSGYLVEYYTHVHGVDAFPEGEAGGPERPVADACGTTRGKSARLEGACMLRGWRSNWFKSERHRPVAALDPIVAFERQTGLRQRWTNEVDQLLREARTREKSADIMSAADMACLLLACHEYNAGGVAARFLPGGRQFLLRALAHAPLLFRGTGTVFDGVMALHPPVDRGLWLQDLAWGVFKSHGSATAADFLVCMMRFHGIPWQDPWNASGREIFGRQLRSALESRDVDRVNQLCTHWRFPEIVPAQAPV